MLKLSRAELQARHERKRIGRMTFSAALFVQQDDYKRGCKANELVTYANDPELRAIVERMVSEGKAHIHIPRMAAREYIDKQASSKQARLRLSTIHHRIGTKYHIIL